MIREWCKRAFTQLTMILAADGVKREFTFEERNLLHDAHSLLSRHQLSSAPSVSSSYAFDWRCPLCGTVYHLNETGCSNAHEMLYRPEYVHRLVSQLETARVQHASALIDNVALNKSLEDSIKNTNDAIQLVEAEVRRVQRWRDRYDEAIQLVEAEVRRVQRWRDRYDEVRRRWITNAAAGFIKSLYRWMMVKPYPFYAVLDHPVECLHREMFVALKKYVRGERIQVSSGLAGETTYGFGTLDDNGYWQYTLFLHPYHFTRKQLSEFVTNPCGST